MTARWDTEGYSDVIDASISWPTLTVVFANGDQVTLDASTVGIGPDSDIRVDNTDPTSVGFGSGSNAPLALGWETIRAATDRDFALHRRNEDRAEAERIGLRLKALREDRGVAQKTLATMVGMKPPQLAKIERGQTDLRLSTVRALLRSLDATVADIAGAGVPEVSIRTMLKRARDAGVDKNVADLLASVVDRATMATALSRAFGFPVEELARGTTVTAGALAVPVHFKTIGASDPRLDPMLIAADQIAQVVAANIEAPFDENADPAELVGVLPLGKAADGLKALIDWCWDHGIPVIPLYGKGGFQAAIWEAQERPTIFMKEGRSLAVWWLFDLAHELGHLHHGHVREHGIVDVNAPRFDPAEIDPQEQEATGFALNLLLGDWEAKVASVRTQCERDPRNLFKGAVERVGRDADVDPGLLGVVAAFALEDLARPNDRWGSAQNLAGESYPRDGWPVVQAAFREHLDIERADIRDRAWMRALTSGG